MNSEPAPEQQDSSHSQPESYVLTRWLFLRLLGLIHLVAFLSWIPQILGLIGSDGILPADPFLRLVRATYGPLGYWLCPTIFWFDASDLALQLFVGVGVVLSVLVVLGIATRPLLAVLAVLYLSILTVAREFAGFQSDGLLVETTVISVLFASWQVIAPPWKAQQALMREPPPSSISLWLLRFLLFRLLFASGAVKLLSGDPTWHHLTAMTFHYETQPIPSPVAWYAAQLPLWFQKMSVVGVFVCELLAPCLIFAPRKMRFIGAALIWFLEFLIALTGNYTFLNYLSMVLCVPLLDDRLLRRVLPGSLCNRIAACVEPSRASTARQAILSTATGLMFFLGGCHFLVMLGCSDILPTPAHEIMGWFEPFRISNGYGMFAVMTTSRPEIIFEGSQDGQNWLAYEFKYKAGDLKRPPPWIAPHLPRLDWRLWFAALDSQEILPWVEAFAARLLQGSHQVLSLLDRNPFPNSPPKYIRAVIYDYHFTNFKERQTTGRWWRRDSETAYMPPESLPGR